MIRELIDTELEAVAGGKFDTTFNIHQKNYNRQFAKAEASDNGVATAFNVGGDQQNVVEIG